MQKLLWLLLLLCIAWGCAQNSSKTSAVNAEKTDETLPATGPDANDLLRIIQGRWQNEQDTGYLLEIIDTDMKYYRNGRLDRESQIVVDGNCETEVCQTDTADLTDGWCFMEENSEGTLCRQVKGCDTTHFRFITIGTHEAFSFVKVKP